MTLKGGILAGLLAVVSIAALPLVTPASAETGSGMSDSLSGQWEFQTGIVNGCVLSGSLVIEPEKPPGISGCRLISYETCSGRMSKVRQSCTARSAGTNLTVISRIEEVMTPTQGELGGLDPYTPEAYSPDNFTVTRTSPDELKGGYFSNGQTTVRFWRKKDLTS